MADCHFFIFLNFLQKLHNYLCNHKNIMHSLKKKKKGLQLLVSSKFYIFLPTPGLDSSAVREWPCSTPQALGCDAGAPVAEFLHDVTHWRVLNAPHLLWGERSRPRAYLSDQRPLPSSPPAACDAARGKGTGPRWAGALGTDREAGRAQVTARCGAAPQALRPGPSSRRLGPPPGEGAAREPAMPDARPVRKRERGAERARLAEERPGAGREARGPHGSRPFQSKASCGGCVTARRGHRGERNHGRPRAKPNVQGFKCARNATVAIRNMHTCTLARSYRNSGFAPYKESLNKQRCCKR